MNAFILAAGEGTRFRPQTLIRPKPALPILNVPLMSFAFAYLQDAMRAGNDLKNLAINTFHLPEFIHEVAESLPKIAENLHFSDERGEILGSGGGLANCESFFADNPHDAIVMINGDEVFLPFQRNFLAEAIFKHKNSDSLATLIVTQHSEVGKQFGGVWTTPDQLVRGFGKAAPDEQNLFGWHYIGIQILSPRIFHYLKKNSPSNILYDGLVTALASEERVQVFPTEGHWYETGNLNDYLIANQKLLDILYQDETSVPGQFLDFVISQMGQMNYSLTQLDKGLAYIASPKSKDGKNILYAVDSNTLEDILSKIHSLQGFLVSDSRVLLQAGSSFENTVLAPSCLKAPRSAQNEFLLT